MTRKLSLPPASISLDLDNEWSYLRIHGDSRWQSFPSYLPLALPRILDFLDSLNMRITFFVVGKDAELPEHASLLRSIRDAGHEIGNHSYQHQSWMHKFSPIEIKEEIRRADAAILSATGVRPRGYRGPGFSLSLPVLQVLKELDYCYDCSTWPTVVGPLARLYYFSTGKFTSEQRAERAALFGNWGECLRPLQPYSWDSPVAGLYEVPVSTCPVFRLPFHMSYILYLSQFSSPAARSYFSICLGLFRLLRCPPSLLLHTLDFLGAEDVTTLSFFPGMQLPVDVKLAQLRYFINQYRRSFEVLPIQDYLALVAQKGMRCETPKFSDDMSDV